MSMKKEDLQKDKSIITSMDDDELKAYYIDSDTKELVEDEVSRRVKERFPLTSTVEKLDEIEKLCNGTFSIDNYCYNSPYSCMLGGKRVRFSSLDEMYYQLTHDDKYFKEQYNYYIDWEWWLGYGHPTSYSDWLKDRHIKL